MAADSPPRLRPYQHDLIREVSLAYRQHRSVLMQLMTGGGKTVIAGSISARIARQTEKAGVIALYLVHRKELVRQVVKTLTDFGFGDEIGVIMAGHPVQRWQPFQVASVQTLVRRLDDVARWLDPRIVFIDEAHHARAETWEKCLERFPGAYRLGLTATPARKDGQGLATHFDHLVLGPAYQTLMDEEALCPVQTFETPSNIDLRGLSKSSGDYSNTVLDKLSQKYSAPLLASAVNAVQRHAMEKRTLHFAMNVRHSRNIVERMQQIGIPSEHVDAKTHPNVRERIMDSFASGQTRFLSNVEIVTEGFDCPACEVVVLGRPTASVALHLQMIGRVMRFQPEKTGLVLDLAGNCHRLGVYPGDDLKWTLDEGVEKPEEIAQIPSHRTCPQCEFSYPRLLPECPLCGYVPTTRMPEEIEVELVEAKRRMKEIRPDRRTLARQVKATRGNDDALEELRVRYGYERGWVHVQHRLYGGLWDAWRRRDEQEFLT